MKKVNSFKGLMRRSFQETVRRLEDKSILFKGKTGMR